jgi:hypothetical protein
MKPTLLPAWVQCKERLGVYRWCQDHLHSHRNSRIYTVDKHNEHFCMYRYKMAKRPKDIPQHKLVLYVVKGTFHASQGNGNTNSSATPTSTANTVKPLILMNELSIDHEIFVVPSPTKDEWFHQVNPHKMVPAMESTETREGKRLNIWESTSCLTYLTDAYDHEGLWKGSDLWERTQVNNWLTLHTAALG